MYVAELGQGYAAAAPSEYYYAMVPKFWKGDGSRRGVVFCHGAGVDGKPGSALGIWDDVLLLASAGFVVVSADLGGPLTFGNDASMARVTDAWNYAVSRFGVKADKLLLIGASMGMTTMANWAVRHPTQTGAIASIIGLHNQIWLYEQGYFRGNIDVAFGGAANWAAVKYERDPLTRAPELGVAGVPVRLWHSPNDGIVPWTFAQQFAAAAGGDVISLGEAGHYAPAADHRQIIDFMAAHAA